MTDPAHATRADGDVMRVSQLPVPERPDDRRLRMRTLSRPEAAEVLFAEMTRLRPERPARYLRAVAMDIAADGGWRFNLTYHRQFALDHLTPDDGVYATTGRAKRVPGVRYELDESRGV